MALFWRSLCSFAKNLVFCALLDALLVHLQMIFGASRDASPLDFARPYDTLATFLGNHWVPLQVLSGSLLDCLGLLFGLSWGALARS